MHSEIKRVRILIDHGGYSFANLGDLAMLQVAVSRIYQHFPIAKLFVFTDSSQTLEKFFPGAIPVLPHSRKNWKESKVIPIPRKLLPEPWTKKLLYLEELIKTRIPRIAHLLSRLIDHLLRSRSQDEDGYFSIIQNADMVIISGGGFIADYFKNHTIGILDTLLLAQKLGKPTAMFGQGIGPLENKPLIKKAQKVFPKLKVLGLREGLTRMDIGTVFNVPKDRIIVTGDDSIELAIKHANKFESRKNIGVNIRLAYYSGDFNHLLPDIGELLEEISRSNGTPIIPIPVQIGGSNSDVASIAQMCDLEVTEFEYAKRINSPEGLLNQINRCRVVVTGSYHAGVFALACGIPVVALVGSDYYDRKFNGLAFQFGLGCKIVQLNSETILADLKKAIENGLHSQNEIESKLIEKAKQQVEISRNAWSRFLALVRY